MGSIAIDYAGLFPVLDEAGGKPGITAQPLPQEILDRVRCFASGEESKVGAFLQTVWAIVLREYVESDSVCFAFCQESGIQACHLSICPGESVSELGRRGGQLSPLSSMSEHNTGLMISRDPPSSDPSSLLDAFRDSQDGPQTCQVLLALEGISQGCRRLILLADTAVISPRQTVHLAATVAHLITEITTNPGWTVGQLSLSPMDEQSVRTWNSTKCLGTNETSILDAIRAKTMAQPHATAICTPNEEWTYAQLDTASTDLALYLHTQGVGPHVFVPLLFHRCPWVVVAQLAVLKAGGAFVPLEPAHPDARLKEILQHANAGFLLASEATVDRAARLADKVVRLGRSFMSSLATQTHPGVLPPPQPDTPAYVLFTSGSTGQPKGCVIEHKAMATIPEQAKVGCMRLSSASRTLQFASYTFAISIFEIYYSLCMGATLCIPFDHDRINNLPGVLRSMRITWACVTPTLLRSLDANHPPPDLRSILIGGEPIRKGEFNAWAAKVDLVYMYGASEVSGAIGFCPHRPDGAAFASFPTMRFWITDAADHEKLKPVGATGELVLESNSLGHGYLNNPETTAAAFIPPPSWRQAFALDGMDPLPLYKTGDLFRQELDGSVRYVGRKGTQVKIRGQRLDLGEVESRVLQSCPRTARVVVETASPADGDTPVLVAFLYSAEYIPEQAPLAPDDLLGASSEVFRSDVQTIRDRLVAALPDHMLPACYIPLASWPLTITGKVNRRALRERAQQCTRTELAAYQSAGLIEHVEPATALEAMLHSVFAEALGVDTHSFGVLHGFVSLGGDSVAAMRAVKLCRDREHPLTVADVLGQQTVRRLAEHLDSTRGIGPISTTSLTPFSLVGEGSAAEMHSFVAFAAEQCKVPSHAVEDIYPCTPLQEGLLVSTLKVQGRYIARSVFDVPTGVDLERLQAAWQTTVHANVMLRTRIIQTPSDGMLQTVISPDHSLVHWQHYPSVEAYYEGDGALSMGPGQLLARFSIIDEPSAGLSIGLTLHHAIFDMHSLRLLLEQVWKAYNGHALRPNSFAPFIQSIQGQDNAAMQEFWKNAFADIQAPVFPSLPHEMAVPRAAAHLERNIHLPSLAGINFTLSNVARLAWAIVVSHHTDSEDVVFGVTVNGRAAPVPGIEEMTGPTIATVPFRVRCRHGETVRDALYAVQSLSLSMIPFEQAGLQNIRRVSPDAAAACDFQSQLIFQPSQEGTPEHGAVMTSRSGMYGLEDYSVFINYVIGLLCTPVSDDLFHVRAQYDPEILPEAAANRLVTQFTHVLGQLCVYQDQRIEQLELVSPDEMEILKKWNSEVLSDGQSHTLHEVVLRNAQKTPLAPAVSSWDQQLTYQDLERLSAQVGRQIMQAGVRPGDRVGLCFEKSVWSVVSMLATLRCGAAGVNIDPALPQGRIAAILQVSQPSVVLTSAAMQSRLHALETGLPILQISSEADSPTKDATAWPHVAPQDIAFILFTSGTTGTPKGIVLEHQHFTTAFWNHREALAAHPGMRTLHFCSYAWDMSLEEVFLTWTHGGCLCIPSETQRMSDLAGFIREHHVNWATMTPSASTILTPDDVPCLKTLVLAGESIPVEIMDMWSSRVRLINAYGPAEAFTCASCEIQPGTHCPGRIGRMVGSAGWVATPHDVNRLAPLGAVGELLIEGPMVTREYFQEREKTQQAYIDPPAWLQKIRSGGPSYRVFRSGDLVRYEENGSLVYVGRKDTQVKLRGQRIVLGDIEHHVQLSVPSAQQVVAEVVRPVHNKTAFLAAFIYEGPGKEDTATDQVLRSPGQDFLRQCASMTARLQEALPAHMVPTAIFPVSRLPQTATGKVDRRQLRQTVEALTPDQLQSYTGGARISEGPKEPPSTPSEMLWQRLWAQALSIPAVRIGRDDHLFRMGGDSITAMKLVALARREGLSHLTFQDVFKSPRLKDLALLSGAGDSMPTLDQGASAPAPFALVKEADSVIQTASEQCRVSVDQIEDAYPCTPLQASLIASTVHRRDAYLALKCYILEEGTNIQRLQRAWESVAAAHAILRTRIIQTATGAAYQVVLKTGLSWSHQESDDPIPATQPTVGLGTPLVHLTLCPGRLLLSIHHALYDGWSMSLLAGEVDKAYRGLPVQPEIPFNSFIGYVKGTLEESSSFWKKELQDADPVHFPAVPVLNYQPKPQCSIDEVVTLAENPMQAKATMASKVKLAWALTVSSYNKSQDVVFGAVSSGRTAPVAGIDAMLGPTIATVPMRVHLDPGQSVSDALQEVQAKSTVQMKYEHLGLQRISQLGAHAAAACRFQTVVVVQAQQDEGQHKHSWFRQDKYLSDPNQFSSHALLLQCQWFAEGNILKMNAVYDTDVLPTGQMRRVLSQFAHLLTQIHAMTETQVITIGDLDMITPQDMNELVTWNPVPAQEDDSGRCVHHLVSEKCHSQPDATAIDAWDGQLTYRQLDVHAARLTRYIQSFGVVSPDSFVALHFEKSLWTVVAQLAVLRAGGAFTMLEPSQPAARLRDICSTVKPVLILTSASNKDRAASLFDAPVVSVDGGLLDKQEPDLAVDVHDSGVKPSHAMYTVATSGTTGKPKVVVIEHRSFIANAQPMINQYGLNDHSRMFQFTGYSFDPIVFDHFLPLLAGGCICIPSQFDRDNRLEQVITEMRANIVQLTTSVIQLLSPAAVPTLKTLVQGGEPMHQGVVDRWASHLQLINAYGPAETTVCACMDNRLRPGSNPNSIGRNTGGACWIVDPDSLSPVPIGAEGELVVEGSIVARGYLNDPDRTAASFIPSPRWLASLREHDKTTTVYRTGDIVRYASDGSIIYLRRKDSQVKLRGQRVELGEVAYHVQQCFPGAAHVVATVATLHHTSARVLVALVLSHRVSGVLSDEDDILLPAASSSRFEEDARAAETALQERVPAYMVPNVFIPVSQIPRDPNGKVDRRLIDRRLSSLTQQDIDQYNASTVLTPPQNDLQRNIRAVWATVLNKAPDEIGIQSSFFRIGGDSITSMQVVAQCTRAGIPITMQDMFKHRTIEQLAAHTTGVKQTEQEVEQGEVLDTPVALSPIQQMFLDHVPDRPNHFNQSFFLCLDMENLNSEAVAHALDTLVEIHSMLRARFQVSSEGQWTQIIPSKANGSRYQYRNHGCQSQHSIEAICRTSQTSLDIKKGPVFIADQFERDSDGTHWLYLVAHHLVIDLVSWRVILADLEQVLTTGSVPKTPPMPFLRWCQLQNEYIRQKPPVLDGSDEEQAPTAYWGEAVAKHNTHCDVDEYTLTLDKETSQVLLTSANDALGTQPVEIVQAAVLHSFVQLFPDRPAPVIFSEGHGREPWAVTIDLTRTVGWFTTIWPTSVSLAATEGALTALRRTKDGRRRTSANGWEYFTSRYLHPQGPKAMAGVEIMMNYQGQFQQLERAGSILKLDIKNQFTDGDAPADMARWALLEVSALVIDDQLRLQFLINRHMRHQDRLQQWPGECERVLREMARQLSDIDGRRYHTVSDFPLLPAISSDEFDEFMSDIRPRLAGAVEDIYPAAPIQQGMLMSQARHPEHYQNVLRWTIRPGNHAIDIQRLAGAWQRVVDRHAALRTVFVEVAGESSQQLVLSHAPARIEIPGGILQDEDDGIRPLPLLKIQTSEQDDVTVELHINHALFDGPSSRILQRDFLQAYGNQLPPGPAPSYGEYIAYLQTQKISEHDDKTYWCNYLSPAAPCLFPRMLDDTEAVEMDQFGSVYVNLCPTPVLERLCEDHGLAVTSVFHLVWAVVLQCYTGASNVCFGHLATGRSAPIPGIQDMVGPITNLLLARVQLQSDTSVISLLQQYSNDLFNSLEHQHCSLAEILHAIGQSADDLFNTVISVQDRRKDPTSTELVSDLDLVNASGEDRSEYPLSLNVAVFESTAELLITYQTAFVSNTYATIIGDTMAQVMTEVLSHPTRPIGELELLNTAQRERIIAQNEAVPPAITTPVHYSIHEHCVRRPDAEMVCAWDGSFTSKQLDELSSVLAEDLVDRGVAVGDPVPIYIEKTRWTPVAILGALKAGGAFVLLDASHPPARLRSIYEDTGASVVLASSKYLAKAADLSSSVIEVGDRLLTAPVQRRHCLPVPVPGDSAAYYIFTSGSTGKPKGIITTHSALATSLHNLLPKWFITSDCRVLQFASHAFDMSIAELVVPLLAGGCTCIPSDEERTGDITAVINRMKVNWMISTPTVARLFNPDGLRHLQTISFGGEAVSPSDLATWTGKARVIVSYGPSEAAIVSTVTEPMTASSNPRTIGRPTGSVAWVVDRDNHRRLVPDGVVGELLVEGPIVAQGYLHDAEKSAAAFVAPPSWLGELRRGGPPVRLYKTGDLVHRAPDGSLIFVGRKDDQIKIRGQRLELGEVEAQVSRVFPGARVVVELVKDASSPFLVAYILQERKGEPSANATDGLVYPPSEEFANSIRNVLPSLHESMPSYMIPSAFLPLIELPKAGTGKTDRKRLREHAASLTPGQLEAYSATSAARRVPETPLEAQLQELVGRVLGRSPDSIPLDEDLFQAGMDSMKGMSLAAETRRAGLRFSVPMLFQHPRLCDLAVVVEAEKHEEATVLPPSALLEYADEICAQWHLDRDTVENIIPATYYQRESVASHHLAHATIHFAQPVDQERLQHCMTAVIQRHSILRGVFVPFQGRYVQIVLRQVDLPVQEIHVDDDPSQAAESICRADAATPVPFGKPPFCLLLVQGRGRVSAVLRLNHAQYDGTSIYNLINDVKALYESTTCPLPPRLDYQDFIAHRTQRTTPAVFQFWREILQGSSVTHLVPHDPAIGRPDKSRLDLQVASAAQIPMPDVQGGVTMATVVKAAWALTLMQYNRIDDAVFVQVSSNRTLPIDGIDRTVGPCVNYVPVRVTLRRDGTARQLFHAIQNQHIRAMSYDTADWDDIVRNSTPWDPATPIGTGVHYLNAPPLWNSDYTFAAGVQARNQHIDFKMLHNYPVMMCVPVPAREGAPEMLHMALTSPLFGQEVADRLLVLFRDAVLRLTTQPEGLVSDLVQ